MIVSTLRISTTLAALTATVIGAPVAEALADNVTTAQVDYWVYVVTFWAGIGFWIKALIVMIGFDIASGLALAGYKGRLSSYLHARGGFKKCNIMIYACMGAYMQKLLLEKGIVAPLEFIFSFYFIINQAISITENLIASDITPPRMAMPLFEKLKTYFENSSSLKFQHLDQKTPGSFNQQVIAGISQVKDEVHELKESRLNEPAKMLVVNNALDPIPVITGADVIVEALKQSARVQTAMNAAEDNTSARNQNQPNTL